MKLKSFQLGPGLAKEITTGSAVALEPSFKHSSGTASSTKSAGHHEVR